jgi:hypothetical protein
MHLLSCCISDKKKVFPIDNRRADKKRAIYWLVTKLYNFLFAIKTPDEKSGAFVAGKVFQHFPYWSTFQ